MKNNKYKILNIIKNMSLPYKIHSQLCNNNQKILNQYQAGINAYGPYALQGTNILPFCIEFPLPISKYKHSSSPANIKHNIYLKENKSIQQALNFKPKLIYYSPSRVQNVPNQKNIESQIMVPQQNIQIYTPKKDHQINTISQLLSNQKQNDNNQKIEKIPLQEINIPKSIRKSQQNINPNIHIINYKNPKMNIYQQNINQNQIFNNIMNNNLFNTPYNKKHNYLANQPIYENKRAIKFENEKNNDNIINKRNINKERIIINEINCI